MLVQRVLITAAADAALPKAGLYWTEVRVFAGATPGAFSFNYDGASLAQFPVSSNGTRGYASYPVNQAWGSTVLNGSSMTLTGGVTRVEVIMADAPGSGPALAGSRGINFFRADGGAVNAGITVSFLGVATAKPRGIVGYSSAGIVTATFPANGGLQAAFDAVVTERQDERSHATPEVGDSASLTLTCASTAACTFIFTVYY